MSWDPQAEAFAGHVTLQAGLRTQNLYAFISSGTGLACFWIEIWSASRRQAVGEIISPGAKAHSLTHKGTLG